MPKSGLMLGLLLSAVGLMGVPDTALAGAVAGRSTNVGQIGQVNTGIGTVGESGFGTTQGLNVYASPGSGSFDLAASGIAPITTSPNNINVQTNIDDSRSIDTSSNLTVTDTINGSNVTYGGNGASINWPQINALGVIDGVASFNASISSNSGLNLTAVTDALETASFLNSQQDN